MKVVVSAPSKLHLSGEHAVVHGNPAVMVTTSKRLVVTLDKLKTKDLKNSIETIRKSDKYINHICQIFEKRHSLVVGNQSLIINSDIPIGRGMGSSAAMATALIGALTKWYGKPWDLAQINELAYMSEKYVHVNSSGGDVSIVCHGGILWYRREFDFLKTFWSLAFKFPEKISNFILIDTGRTESAGELIMLVSRKVETASRKLQLLFSQIEDVTKKMVLAIKFNDEKLFSDSIKKNENYLEKLGVVSKSTKKLIGEIEIIGGAAKISGAGGIKTGSGIIIGYHQNPQKLISIANKHNYPYFQVKLGEQGVRVERIIT